MCQYVTYNKLFGDSLLTIVQPKITCPAKKGTYVAINTSIDTTALNMLPIGGNRWSAELASYIRPNKDSESVLVGCFILDVTITEFRSRKKN